MRLIDRSHSVESMDLASRLRAAIDATGRTQSWIAEHAGVPDETISRIVTRETKNPQIVTLLKLAPVLGVTVGWLLGEKIAPFTDAESRAIASAIDILRLRLDGDAIDSAGAPNASAAEQEIPREYAVRGARLVFRAAGESMLQSGIIDGDRLYVREVKDIRRAADEIVVCRLGDATFVKRLQFEGGRIRLLSANERYEPIVVDEKHDDFSLLGIVIGRSGDV